MLLVSGLGRTGTSMMMVYLKNLGLKVGPDVMGFSSDIRAGMEFGQCWYIQADMYHDMIKNEKIDPDQYKERINDLWEYDAVKDPRFTFHPEIIRAWRTVRQDWNILVMHRDPIKDIYLSRMDMPISYQYPKDGRDEQMLRDDFIDHMNIIGELGIKFRMLLYPDCLYNYPKVYKVLTDLGIKIDYDTGKAKWEELVKPEYVTVSNGDYKYYITGKEDPEALQIRNEVCKWEAGSIPFSSYRGWDKWGILGIMADFAAWRNRDGCIVEIGVGETSLYLSKVAKKYNKRIYHCEKNKNYLEKYSSVNGYFNKGLSHIYNTDPIDFLNTVKDLNPICIAVINSQNGYEQVKQYFNIIFDLLIDNGYVFIHNTYPPYEKYIHACGDTYKLRQELEKRKDIECFTFTHTTAIVGLTMIRKKTKTLLYFQE